MNDLRSFPADSSREELLRAFDEDGYVLIQDVLNAEGNRTGEAAN